MVSAVPSSCFNTPATRLSTRAAFFIAGFGMGTWAPLVPFAQQRLNLDAGNLGMLLLCLGIGSLVAMLFSGKLAGRFGCRAMITTGSVAILTVFPFLALSDSLPLMSIALLIFGAGIGLTDVTVNIQGALVEKHAKKPLMSGFHGLFSVGGIVGAAGGSIALRNGLSPLTTAMASAVVVLFVLSVSFSSLLPCGSDDTHQEARLRVNGRLILMAIMCMICFLAEGAMLDWGGVWLTTERGMAIQNAGWGYAMFGCAMAFMRLTGDKAVKLLGRNRLLLLSGLLAMSGFMTAVFLPGWEASLAGFALVGIGAANVAPVITTLAGQEQIMPPNMSVALVSTIGYLGILMGPALLGFIAHNAGLATAFLSIAFALIMVVGGAVKLRYS